MKGFIYKLNKKIRKLLKVDFSILKDYHKQQIILNLKFEDCFGLNNKITIGQNCKIEGLSIIMRGNNNILEIGKNNKFKRGSSIWLEGNNLITKIGDNNTFEGVHLANTEENIKLEIGNDCMFSYGIEIRTGDSHSIIDCSNTKNRINYAKDVIISDHCWIGANVFILKGVQLQPNTIIGIGSIITKAYDAGNCVIAGNPAQIKKTHINWLRERI